MTFKFSLGIKTLLAAYAYGPPGAHSADTFQRTVSVITSADETRQNNDSNLGKTFDSDEQSKERKGRKGNGAIPSSP